MRHLLITGVSGFLAHHIISEAQKGKWEVIGIDKRPIPKNHSVPNQFIQTDVNDLGFRDLLGVDAVVHLAWRTNIPDCVRHPKESTFDNIDMSIHLLEICREANIRKVIFPSTASLYSHNLIPWTEDMQSEPIEPYSWQKLAIEYACQMYSKNYKLPTVILRFFQVFGEFQRPDTAISVFLKKKEENKPIQLVRSNNKKRVESGKRDFIYAGDLAKAVMLAVKSKNTGNGEIINIASGKSTSIEEVAKIITDKIEWVEPRGYEVDEHLADIKKARLLLNWQPEVEVIDWLKNYGK